MASGLNDPKLLYAIPGVSAYRIANGVEASLTPAGPQTLSLLMVPTASPYADSSLDPQAAVQPAEEDFYLHLHLPPELDLPLPATTQIYHQPPTSYLIPRWDLGRNSGVFTRIEFPAVGSRKGLQEDVDTFETILAQCTAFLERAPPPKMAAKKQHGGVASPPRSAAAAARSAAAAGVGASSSHHHATHAANPASRSKSTRSTRSTKSAKSAMTEELPAYNPQDFRPGEAYVPGSHSSQAGGQIVLIDEEDGSVIGELGDGFQVVEDQTLKPGSKDPVEITLPTDAVPSISVAPASPQYIEELHPAYKKSFLVANAAAASRLIVTTSEVVSKALQNQAESYAKKAQPANTPMTFKPATRDHARRVHTLSSGAAGLSAKAVTQVGKVAQNLGASLAGHKPRDKGNRALGLDENGEPLDQFKPGLLNKSLIAFSTVADGIEQAGRQLMETGSSAATTVVGHKWGPEAGELTKHVSGGIKNVGLVYIDVTGVSRRAIIKSVAKGMVVGRVPGGGDLIVGGGDGGNVATLLPADASGSGSVSRVNSTATQPSTSRSDKDSRPSGSVRSTSDFADKNPYRGL